MPVLSDFSNIMAGVERTLFVVLSGISQHDLVAGSGNL